MAEAKAARLAAKGPDRLLMSDNAKGQDYPELGHGRDLGFQKGTAVSRLVREGFVLRRDAAHRVGDPGTRHLQPVTGPGLVSAVSEPEFMQCRVEKIARVIAGKGPPGSVGAAKPGGQADDEQFCGKGAKGRDRSIVPVGVGGCVFAAELA